MSSEQSDWTTRMVDLIEQVSDELPDEAKQLLREDEESLDRYLGSSGFMDDLKNSDDPLSVDVETFFAVLFKQFHRRLEENEQFRQRFNESVDEFPGNNWSVRKTRDFFQDEALISYLLGLLKKFVKTEDVYQIPGQDDEEYRYIVDMLDVAVEASDHETFQIYCHIGNYSLYLTGVFPDWIQHRHEFKNRPLNIDSYRTYGKTYFERAAEHEMARKRELRPVLSKLGRGYDLVRTSIHLMFEELTPSFSS